MSRNSYYDSDTTAGHQDLSSAVNTMRHSSVDTAPGRQAQNIAGHRMSSPLKQPTDSPVNSPSVYTQPHLTGLSQVVAQQIERILEITQSSYHKNQAFDYYFLSTHHVKEKIQELHQQHKKILLITRNVHLADEISLAEDFCTTCAWIREYIEVRPREHKSLQRTKKLIPLQQTQLNTLTDISKCILTVTQELAKRAKVTLIDLCSAHENPHNLLRDSQCRGLRRNNATQKTVKACQKKITELQCIIAAKDTTIDRQTRIGLNQSEVVKEKTGTNTAERVERAHARLEQATTTKRMVSETIYNLSTKATGLTSLLNNATITESNLSCIIIGKLHQAKQDTFKAIADEKNKVIQKIYAANLKKLSDRLDIVCQDQRKCALKQCAESGQEYIDIQRRQFMNRARSGHRKAERMEGLLKLLSKHNNPAQLINEAGIKAVLDWVHSMRYNSPHDKVAHPDCKKGGCYRDALDKMLAALEKPTISPPELEDLEEADHYTPALTDFLTQQKAALTRTISEYCKSHNHAIQHAINALKQLKTGLAKATANLQFKHEGGATATSSLANQSLLTDSHNHTHDARMVEASHVQKR